MKIQSAQSRHFLVELIVNLLFFFIMAAVCLSIFTNGHTISNNSHTLSMATLQAQSAAESFKASKGDTQLLADILNVTSSEDLNLYYDENWLLTSEENAVYTLNLDVENSSENMHSATIAIAKGDDLIYTLEVKSYNEFAKGGSV